MKNRYRSELGNSAKAAKILKKIRELFALKPTSLVFRIDQDRFSAAECANVAISETGTTGNVAFRRPPNASAAAKASLAVQALLYTADTGGTAGNAITIQYVNTGTAGSEVVHVTSSAIQIEIQSGVSTAAQIKAAVDASVAAAALVDVSLLGAGSATQVTYAATNLAGGAAQSSLETYDVADIQIIKRLRTKKWLLSIKSGSNPA